MIVAHLGRFSEGILSQGGFARGDFLLGALPEEGFVLHLSLSFVVIFFPACPMFFDQFPLAMKYNRKKNEVKKKEGEKSEALTTSMSWA